MNVLQAPLLHTALPRPGSSPKNGPDGFVRSPSDDAGLMPSPQRLRERAIRVDENEWRVGELDTPYVIHTGGCGAMKIFVQGESGDYCIVFHSFGEDGSKTAARQLGNYIVGQENTPRSLRILCLQPYDISKDVMQSLAEIHRVTEQAGIPTQVHSICLNNLDHEDYSQFIQLEMTGSEQQILERYSHWILRDRPLSPEDRQKKIALFQSIPLEHRTSALLKRWSGLSLEEARGVAQGLTRREQSWGQRLLHWWRSPDGVV